MFRIVHQSSLSRLTNYHLSAGLMDDLKLAQPFFSHFNLKNTIISASFLLYPTWVKLRLLVPALPVVNPYRSV
jgi:hypothetical protein